MGAAAFENLAIFEAGYASFLDRFLTQDEYWVHHFEPVTKRQVEAPWLTTSKEGKVITSAGKVMASVFWDADGIMFIAHL